MLYQQLHNTVDTVLNSSSFLKTKKNPRYIVPHSQELILMIFLLSLQKTQAAHN